jgi:hypothetical protein
MDGAVNSTSAQKTVVGRVHDHVNLGHSSARDQVSKQTTTDLQLCDVT